VRSARLDCLRFDRDFLFMNTETEIWKDVDGYEGVYQISDLGNVKSFSVFSPQGKIMKLKPESWGYLSISLYHKGRNKKFLVHRLVAMYFHDNPHNKPQVNHINGIKTDNRAVNVEWCTPKENMAHASLNNLRPFGEKSNFARLTEQEAKEIYRIGKLGGTKYAEIAKMFNVSRENISSIVRRKTWRRANT